jgi:hypothetical protein
MSEWIKNMGFAALVVIADPSTAGDIKRLIDAARSFHITPQEKALFIEAKDKFKKYTIPPSIEFTDIFWLDEEHLVMSTQKYPGWEAKPEDLPRIISYNLATGVIVDSGYRGLLGCMNHLGELLLKQSEKKYGRTTPEIRNSWLTGVWGKELRKTDYISNSFIPNYLCQFTPIGDAIYSPAPENKPSGSTAILPLLPAHGAIENTAVTENGQIQDRLQLIKPDGQRIPIAASDLRRFEFYYQPWNDVYFEVRTAPDQPRNFSPSGKVHCYDVPTLFLVWGMTLQSSATAFPSKNGILWRIQQGNDYWLKQGIFLQTSTEILRIEDSKPISKLKVSPSGCKLHARVIKEKPSNQNRSQSISLIIDLCKESSR